MAALLSLSAVAWWATHRLATPDMRLGILTETARPTGDAMSMEASMGVGLFVTMWAVMMTAMMLPSVAPVIVGVSRLTVARDARRGAPSRAAYGMVAGYLLVWVVIGIAAYALFTGFQSVVSAGDVLAARVGGLVLLVAGVFQLSPLKRVCLRHCRSPLAVLAHYGEAVVRGRTGPLRVGVHHGFYCVGCCWALMAILLAAGMMSLVWMGVVAAVVLTEKVHRRGEALGRGLGVLLVAFGLVFIAAPSTLPMFV